VHGTGDMQRSAAVTAGLADSCAACTSCTVLDQPQIWPLQAASFPRPNPGKEAAESLLHSTRRLPAAAVKVPLPRLLANPREPSW
jgi:hypothetical protein